MNTNSGKSQPAPISRKRATLSLAFGGYLNTGIQIVQGLLVVPLCLHFIGSHLYGVWLASGGILGMLGVMNLGLGNLLIQRVAQAYGRQDFSKAADYFINGLFVYLILSAAFIVLGLLISFGLAEVLKDVGDEKDLLRECFQLALVAAGLGLVNECLRGFAHALLRPLYSALALAGSRIFGLVATVVLLYREAGLWAIPMGMLLTEGLVLLFGLIQTVILFRGLGACWNLSIEQIREYFRMGGILFASRLGHALSREADPLLITLFLAPEVTAAYMVTRKGADIVFQLLAVVYGAAHGAFSHLAGAADDARIGCVAIQLLTLVFFAGLVGFTSYVALNSNFVTLWVGGAFALDQGLILLIGLAYFLNSLRNMVLQLLNGLGEFDMSSRVVLLEGLAKTGLTAWLLSWIGVVGAPLALAMVCLSTLFILGVQLKGRLRLPIALPDFVGAMIAVGLLFGVAVALPSFMIAGSWWQFILLAGACVMVTASISVLLNWNMFKKQLKIMSL